MSSHVSSPDDDEEFIIETVFEHERKTAEGTWTSEKGWLDEEGNPAVFFPGKPDEDEEEKKRWFDDWEVANSDEECDADGWIYAPDFDQIDSHASAKCGDSNFVRRRRWVRHLKGNRAAELSSSTPENTNNEENAAANEGFPRGPHIKGVCCWSEPDSTTFSLRGATYMSDRLKIRSAQAVMQLLHIDLFSAPTRIDRVCDKPDGFLALQRSKGDNRFVLCVNFQAPPHHMAVYFGIPEDASSTWDAQSFSLWEKFINGDDAFRNARWKVIPSVVEGPWMIKKSVGQKPALLGSKLQHTYHREASWFEIDCNIYSSTTATWLVELLKGYSTAFAIDIGFCIQGNEPEELPERVLGALRMSRPNLGRARRVEWS